MDLKFSVAVVDEEDVNDTSIVGVDDASANVDGKLACEATTRGHVAISS